MAEGEGEAQLVDRLLVACSGVVRWGPGGGRMGRERGVGTWNGGGGRRGRSA